ncbi:DNA repair protein RecO [Methylobacterium brachythecii]|uniref:DNA repair protein RecO n=1 Tax=Methylobacterium brachythecii TaxID=1176177 RepID=A0A7W6AKZ9_9HYPH|nr:DNA repair protein RecO [Methylobacterium brachythecii]MBB3902701.1 DNA repair protein RecO (recombination protein O) [Methylobacterium brachythecii]GLS42546.1 DNA repair protein RecO [Methylobacterium brachythecii]
MQWSDDGLVIGLRKHGETGVILELMTAEHGRHLGLVHGGRSRRMQPMLQPGNTLHATWRARIDESLGSYTVEPASLVASRLMGSALALYGIGHMGALLRLLPERDPHLGLYDAAQVLVEHLGDRSIAPALMVRFELALLTELGFGLDLSNCAATGVNDALIYVSPKTGRAVSASAGEPYRDRLLKLPAFLRDRSGVPSDEEIAQGFRLTGYFLAQYIWEPRGLQPAKERARFMAAGSETTA